MFTLNLIECIVSERLACYRTNIGDIIWQAVVRRCSVKKVFLKTSQNSQESTYARVYILIKLQALESPFIKKETLAQMFSGEFCKIYKNTFFYRTPLVPAFDIFLLPLVPQDKPLPDYSFSSYDLKLVKSK